MLGHQTTAELNYIPLDIWLRIASHLSLFDFIALSSVSKSLHVTFDPNDFHINLYWKNKFKKHYLSILEEDCNLSQYFSFHESVTHFPRNWHDQFFHAYTIKYSHANPPLLQEEQTLIVLVKEQDIERLQPIFTFENLYFRDKNGISVFDWIRYLIVTHRVKQELLDLVFNAVVESPFYQDNETIGRDPVQFKDGSLYLYEKLKELYDDEELLQIEQGGRTFLHWVLFCNQRFAIIQENIDPNLINALDCANNSVFDYANDHGDTETILYLLKEIRNSDSIFFMDSLLNRAFYFSVFHRNIKLCTILLEEDTKIQLAIANGELELDESTGCIDKMDYHVLPLAINHQDIPLTKLLIQYQVGIAGFCGMYALEAATRRGNIEIVELLLKEGVQLNNKEGQHHSLLLKAVRYHQIEIAEMFLKHEIDINATDSETGYSALMLAVKENDYEMVKLLLLHGASLSKQIETVDSDDVFHIKDADFIDSGKTVMDLAAEWNRRDILLLLKIEEIKLRLIEFLKKNHAHDVDVYTNRYGKTSILFFKPPKHLISTSNAAQSLLAIIKEARSDLSMDPNRDLLHSKNGKISEELLEIYYQYAIMIDEKNIKHVVLHEMNKQRVMM